MLLAPPFPYPGSKRRIVNECWRRLGDPARYIEVFSGSSIMILNRPFVVGRRVEVMNDIDAFVVNFFRSVARFPGLVARWASWPVTEVDIIARSLRIFGNYNFIERMKNDPDLCNPKIAGQWAWLMSSVIGGRVVRRERINASIPYVSSHGQGINIMQNKYDSTVEWMRMLYDRLIGVKIVCGDWRRVLTPAVIGGGPTGIFLDPPYPTAERRPGIYNCDDDIWPDVCAWCEEHGNDMNLRIALCGYDGTWDPPDGWTTYKWVSGSASRTKAKKQGRNKINRFRERVWFSPGCCSVAQGILL